MNFDWHDVKAEGNRRKHGVTFELAMEVWNDPHHIVLPDRVEDGEQRWHALGLVGHALLLVVHTYPDPDDEEFAWIIGARRATVHERKRFEDTAFS